MPAAIATGEGRDDEAGDDDDPNRPRKRRRRRRGGRRRRGERTSLSRAARWPGLPARELDRRSRRRGLARALRRRRALRLRVPAPPRRRRVLPRARRTASRRRRPHPRARRRLGPRHDPARARRATRSSRSIQSKPMLAKLRARVAALPQAVARAHHGRRGRPALVRRSAGEVPARDRGVQRARAPLHARRGRCVPARASARTSRPAARSRSTSSCPTSRG